MRDSGCISALLARRGAEHVGAEVVAGDAAIRRGLDSPAVMSGNPSGTDPAGDRLGFWPQTRANSAWVDGSRSAIARWMTFMRQSKQQVDRPVNLMFVDADERSTDHQRMVDSLSYNERFMEVVSDAGCQTRSAFADFLGVSKQVVQNWYARDGAIPQDRRHLIESRTGFSIDWINDGTDPKKISRSTPSPLSVAEESQTARLDPEKVRDAYQAVRAIYADNGKVYDIEAEPDLFATVYERLVQIAGRPSIVEMARIGRVIEEHRGSDDEGRERVERAGSAYTAASKGRAAS